MFVLHAVGADHRHRAVQPAARKVTLADDAEVRHGGLDILAQRGGHFAAARFDQGAGRFVVRKNFQQRAKVCAHIRHLGQVLHALQVKLRAGANQRFGGEHHRRQPAPGGKHQACRQRRGQILRCHKGQAAVQQAGHLIGILPRQAGVDTRHTGAHTAGAGNRQNCGGIPPDLHDLKMGDAQILGLRGGSHCGTAGIIGQCAGGALRQLFGLNVHIGKQPVNVFAVRCAQCYGGGGFQQVV